MTDIEKESAPVKGLTMSPGPLLKRSRTASPYQSPLPHKRRKRTKQDFLNFCRFVLQYEAYKQDENNNKEKSFEGLQSMSPESSSGSDILGDANNILMDERIKSRLTGSQNESSNSSTEETQSGDENVEVTCFCGKPFANRPMIECSSCEVWIHLSCAKIRKNHIPEVFICPKCREISNTSRKSPRVRVQNKKFDTDL